MTTTYVCKAALASIAAAHALQEISASNEEFDYDLVETTEDNLTDHFTTDLAQAKLEADEEIEDEDYANSGSDDSEYEGLALAQVFAQYEQSNPTCTTAQERLREGPEPDFYKYQSGEKKVKKKHKDGYYSKYKDQSFNHAHSQRWDSNPHILDGPWSSEDHEKNTKWKRIGKEYPADKGYSLWGNHKSNWVPTPEDIRQGELGDCWFLAAASAMAEIPERLEKIFFNYDQYSSAGISDKGIYAVNMYALMMPIKVTIHDRLPFRKVKKCTNYLVYNDCKTTSNNLYYAKVGEDKSVWAPLLETAFAKYHGTYEAIVGGWPDEALEVLAGSPGYQIRSDDNSDGPDNLWNQLIAVEDTTMVTNQTNKDWKGIVGYHAYTVLRAVQVGDGPRLIEVRNPWGKTEFTGDWGHKSSKWTPELKNDYHYEEKNDGKFFIEYQDYKEAFYATNFNYDVSDWTRASFLMLDDQTEPEGENQGKHIRCGKKCVRHTFTLESAVDQHVIVSASTYLERGYPAACEAEVDHRHILSISGQSWSSWEFGTRIREFEMSAGETKTVWVEMDYTADMMKDFSVVAWGKEGGLTLTNNQGLESNEFPDINPEE